MRRADFFLGLAAAAFVGSRELGCFAFFNDGNAFSNGVEFDTPKAVPSSMIAADLNRDGRPDIAHRSSDSTHD